MEVGDEIVTIGNTNLRQGTPIRTKSNSEDKDVQEGVKKESAKKAHFNIEDTPTEFAEKILKSMNRRIFKVGNKHLWKQIWYLPKDFKRIDHLIKLENLQQDWPFDFPCPDYKINTTKNLRIKVDEEIIYQAYYEDYSAFKYSLG